MEVPSARFLVVRSGRFLYARKDHSGVGMGGLLIGPDVPIAVFRIGIRACLFKPRVLIGGVIETSV
jgi:hypothetical protein